MDKIMPTHVLLTNAYYKPNIGGIENSLYHIGTLLNRMGHVPVILASDIEHLKKQRLDSHEIIDDLLVYRYVRPRKPLEFVQSTEIIQIARLVSRLNKTYPFKAIIARDYKTLLGARRALHGLPTVYIVPGIARTQDELAFEGVESQSLKQRLVNLYAHNFLIPTREKLQKLAMEKSDHVVVFSHNMKQQVMQLAPNLTTIHQVSPGVDTTRFAPNPDRNRLRSELGVSPDAFVCLCLGRITAHKGLNYALEAIKHLQDRNDILLIIVGDGPQLVALKDQTQALGLDKMVRFEGITKVPERYFAMADVFIMSSIHESFGQTILEAMASGLPVIAFDDVHIQTANRELIKDGKNGLLCNLGADNLASCILRLHEMPIEMRTNLGYNGRKLVQDHYSWNQFTIKLLKLVSLEE